MSHDTALDLAGAVVADTSALVAIALREPGYERIFELLTSPLRPAGIGTATAVELGIVLSARFDRDGRPIVDELIELLELTEIAFERVHWREAVRAFRRYGRGRHQAQLNFGDCMSYAVARVANRPLLFVGDDFTHTDIVAA